MEIYKYIGTKPALFNGVLLEPEETIEGDWNHPLLVKTDKAFKKEKKDE
jgi:hypothetical protein